MSRKTGQTMLCGGKRRRLGSSRLTGPWINTEYRQTPSCSSHLNTNSSDSSFPTWSTWRWKWTSLTESSKQSLTSARLSVSICCFWRPLHVTCSLTQSLLPAFQLVEMPSPSKFPALLQSWCWESRLRIKWHEVCNLHLVGMLHQCRKLGKGRAHSLP